MALNSFYYDNRWASSGGTFSESATVNFPSNYVRAATALQVVGNDADWAEAQIVEYVQNGTPHHGTWQEINGPGITSVSWALTVVDGYAQGSLNVDIFS